METASEKQHLLKREVPIEWVVPDSVPGGYVTNLIVQHTEHEYVLLFFEVRPPLVLGPEDVEATMSVKAQCVARITISPGRMPDFVKAMQANQAKYSERFGERAGALAGELTTGTDATQDGGSSDGNEE